MKIRRKPILYGFIFYFIVLNLFIGFALANSSLLHISTDNDGDGIDDDIEDQSLRDVNITLSRDHVEIVSILRNGLKKDRMKFEINYDINDGVCVEVYYDANYKNQTTGYELEFEIGFQKIIEFIDLDNDSIYNPLIDNEIEETKLDSFNDFADYTIIPLSNDTTLHNLNLNSSDNMFIFHIYVAEEFTMINNSLLTPTQIKVDFDINNYIFNDIGSQLALYTQLKSRTNYTEVEKTYDEKKGYASEEKGVQTLNDSTYLGYFTWSESAYLNGTLNPINTSGLSIDDEDLTEQKMYINFPRGNFIYHETKIGVTDVPKSKPIILEITIFILVIGSVSIAAGYSIYHHQQDRTIPRKLEKGPMTNGLIIKLLDEDNVINKLIKMKDVNITAISEDFLDRIDQLDLNEEDKKEFFKEMLALTPKEREEILDEMSDNLNDKNMT